jgi:hypothetical protein
MSVDSGTHKTPTRTLTILFGAALMAWGCAPATETPASSEVSSSSGLTLPISYNEAMVAVVDHAAHELWNAVAEENIPQTDEDWTELEHHAWQLVVASTAIQLPGTGVGDATWSESPEWGRLAREMGDTAMASAEAIRGHDLAALSAEGDTLVEICTECHEVFKPEVPSEGIFHPHYR